VKTARFNPQGGPIVAAVTCVPRRDGSYTLTLWNHNENAFGLRVSGNFINTADDSFTMSTPNSQHNGRLLEVIATVAVPPGTGGSDVCLIVLQDGAELARDCSPIPPNSPAGMADLFVELVSQ
jgi:hypothetical protein